MFSDSTELPSAVVLSPRLSYKGSCASELGKICVLAVLDQLGTLGLLGIVTYPCLGVTTGGVMGAVNGDCEREYGRVLKRFWLVMPYIGECIGLIGLSCGGSLVVSGTVEALLAAGDIWAALGGNERRSGG